MEHNLILATVFFVVGFLSFILFIKNSKFTYNKKRMFVYGAIFVLCVLGYNFGFSSDSLSKLSFTALSYNLFA
ncbi:hypothetical protein AAHJ69_004416 [Salmonella enterica]|nr:hypothetical protein [Salmonella enterica]